MWSVYLYFMCIYSLLKLITSQYNLTPEISDLSLGKICMASIGKSVCAQINSPLTNGPFYEPLCRLRRHMAPNGFNTSKLIKWMQQTLINIPYREIYCQRNLTAVVQSVRGLQQQQQQRHTVATLVICIIQDFIPYKTVTVIFNLVKL